MTCAQAVSRLDDLVDSELSPEVADGVRAHIDSCRECQREYEITLRLKELLRSARTPDPGGEYFQEATELILGRSVGNDPTPEDISPQQIKSVRQQAFWRAVLSVAASLAILFAAILIGSSEDYEAARQQTAAAPVLATTDIRGLIGPESSRIFTREDQLRLARGALLIGSPSFVARFAGIPDMMETYGVD